MSTIVFRLAGPMQSWGTQSRFDVRDTGREPSKSGVVGLVCAALGRPRSEPVEDLAALRMGVRVDREGSLARDYQTAGGSRDKSYGVRKASGKGADTVTSTRYYLADADFLAGLEGEDPLLDEIAQGLDRPRWQLYLGRKSYVPSTPMRGETIVGSLDEVLAGYPWEARTVREAETTMEEAKGGEPRRLRLVLDAQYGTTPDVRYDVPVSFADGDRRFTARCVRTTWVPLTEDLIRGPDAGE